MATWVGKQASPEKFLRALIELDMDAIEAYRTAIERLDGDSERTWLQGFRDDHERHVQELSCALEKAQGHPPTGPDLKQYVTKGKVMLADWVGDDYDILVAMRTNENDTNTAYERAVKRDDISKQLRDLLERNLQDERRHRAWLEERITFLEEQREDRENRAQPPTMMI